VAENGATSSHAAAVVEEHKEEAIFLGDTGSLPIDTRRVLVQLLLGPSVDARRQTKLWPVLLRDETVIRSRMHELFLEVVIDHEQQVAFTRQVTSEELEVPILLRKASLTFLETALLLFLRQRLTQADAEGERAVVSLSDMQEHLGVFERDNNPDHAKFGRQVVNDLSLAFVAPLGADHDHRAHSPSSSPYEPAALRPLHDAQGRSCCRESGARTAEVQARAQCLS